MNLPIKLIPVLVLIIGSGIYVSALKEGKPSRPLSNNIQVILIPTIAAQTLNSNEDKTLSGLDVIRNNKLRIGLHVMLALLLWAISWIFNIVIRSDALRRSNKWIVNLKHTGLKQTGQPDDQTSGLSFPTEGKTSIEHSRLEEQLKDTQRYARYHMQVLRFFYAYYYMSILLFTTSGVGAAIALVLISKRGWDQSNEYLITTFFVMTAITLFYNAMPKAFAHVQNIAENKALYLKYISLENEIRSYAVTGEPMHENQEGTGNQNTTKDFIHYIDRQLAASNIALGLDDANAPTIQTLFSTLKS